MMDINSIIAIIPQPVVLSNIDDSPGPCCMSFGFELTPLMQSIKRVGLINPPLLKRDNEARITIITGYRRIKALKLLKADRAACRILSGDDILPIECLLLNLHDNLAVRELNDVEKGMVLARLIPWIKSREIVEHYMPLLGLPSKKATLSSYLRLEEEMGIRAKECIAQGQLSLRNAMMLLDIDSISRSSIIDLISNIKLTVNQQRQLIDYTVDLAHIEGTSIPDILDNQSVKRIKSDTRMNNPQKGRTLIRHFRIRRYPSVSMAEREFKKMVSRLNLGEMVRIDHSSSFEFPYYRLEVLFKDGPSLREKLENLMGEDINILTDPWKKDLFTTNKKR
jgi:hypothetical protein